MTGRELCERLKSTFPELEKRDCALLVDSFFEVLTEALKEGKKIELRGFGVIELSKGRAHFFYNPRNQQKYYLKSKVRAIFHLGKELKERLNTPFLAGLDLGTQTFRLILGKYFQGEVIFLKSFRENVRLGEGLSDSGKIKVEALERALRALKSFQEMMEKAEVKDYYAIGTAVFRKAANAPYVLKRFEEELGLKVEVLSPEKEAELTLEGILYGLKRLNFRPQSFLVVDVGGGSTEFIYLKEGSPRLMKSLELGAVHLKELFNVRYPLTRGHLESLRKYVQDQLAGLPQEDLKAIVITGGTASLLGSLDLKLTNFEPERLHGHLVTKDRITKLIQKISEMTLPRISKMKGMEEGRADIALPGLLIFEQILNYFKKEEVLISEFGILEATLLSLTKKYN